jgi:flavodoxin
LSTKTLVVYDSAFGNTEKIAKAIGEAIGGDVTVLKASGAAGSLTGVSLLIVGAPTYGGRPTPPMLEFLDKIPATGLQGVKVATFDTRLTSKLVSVFGVAAKKIAASLESKGGIQMTPPEGFFVKGREGPLVGGETQRAAAWGRTIAERVQAA